MKNFCPLPWTHLFLHTTGTTKLCCVSTDRAWYQSLTNNPSFNKARLKMLKGERPEECYSYCYKTEDNGGMSKRQQQLVNPPNDQFTYQDAVNNTNADGTIKKELIYDLDLRIGNTCDLACIMCGSINSSKWAELERSINIKTGMEKPAGISKWWEDKKFWEELNEILRNAKLIKFGGGEPLLLKQHKDVLKFLKENNPNCTIKYITNANNITQEYIDLWQDLPNLRFTLSIDSIKERIEYLRWPIKWDNLIKNIHMLKQLKRPPAIAINYTISLFNILYVNDDLNWFLPRLKELGIKHFNPSHVWGSPNFLHPGLLPDEIKDTIKIDVESGTEQGWHIASNINSYLYSRSYDKELLKQFVEYAKQLDSARGTNVLETFPRLKCLDQPTVIW
jgi:hypothetical protein